MPVTGVFYLNNPPAQMRAGTAPVSLLSLQTISGTRAYFATMKILAPAQMTAYDVGGLQPETFDNRLLQAPAFRITSTTATATATAAIENVSGNTVERAGSKLFAAEELWGAQFIYQLWSPTREVSIQTVLGSVSDARDLGDTLRLSLKDLGNWAEIPAPDCVIGPNCQNVFGSKQCGSTSPTPCNNDWGSCTQRNRFKGIVQQWDSTLVQLPAVSYAQPAPQNSINSRRPA